TSKYKIHPLVREYCYKRLKSDADKLILAHSKAASFLQDTLAEDFEISIGKELFHHLYFAEDLDGMANLIDSHGSKFILGGHLNALQDMLKVIEDQNVSQHISDYLRGEIAEIRGEWDAALEYFTKAFDSSNKELSADAFIRYGEVLYHKAEYKEALGYFETAHETCRGISYEKGEARSLIDIGVIYRVFEEYSVAKKKYTEALEINKKIGNKLGISRALSHLASIYYEKNDFRHAHELENRSLKIAEELGVKVDIANILSSQGNMLAEEGHSKKALKKFNLSLSIYEEIGDKKAISTYWFNVGYVHYELVNKSKALDLFFKSLKISEEIGDKEGQSICHNRIGKLYFEDKKSAIALEHLVASYAFEKQVGVKYHDSYKEIKVIKKRLNRYEFEKLAKEAISKLPEYLKEYVTFEEIAAMQPDKKQELTDNVSSKIGRNDPCPCESGKKYKKCCGKN
ncbi:MAG: tetratricopeptide repeat protein, partial [Thermodesulfovibrionales bacterium]|nr:tetratricopeptide repeat protein [Thermodesulfovibrionales bacterium]